MKSLRITELHLTYFRGATNKAVIKFDSQKPLVVVFGENGTGKSTIVDALDLIANGKVGSLEDRSSAKMSHAPAIGRKATEVNITLMRGTQKWIGTIKGTKPQIAPADVRPAISILRRSQLLQLVEAVPTKRYEALQGFIDVSGIENSEFELDRAVKSSKQEIASAIANRLKAEEQLAELWASNGKPDNTWMEWAKTKSEIDTTELVEQISEFNSLIATCESYTSSFKSYDTAITAVTDAKIALADLVKERGDALVLWTERTPKIIETLTAAESLINAGWDQESCPICQQQIAPEVLKLRVSDALDAMKSLKDIFDREAKGVKAVELAEHAAAGRKSALLEAIRGMLGVFKASTLDSVTKLGA